MLRQAIDWQTSQKFNGEKLKMSFLTKHKYIRCFILNTKIKLKLIIDLNIRTKTIKCLEKNIMKNLHDCKLGKEFLDVIPKA